MMGEMIGLGFGAFSTVSEVVLTFSEKSETQYVEGMWCLSEIWLVGLFNSIKLL